MLSKALATEDVRKTLRCSLTIIAIFSMLLWTLIVCGIALAHSPTYCGHSIRWMWPYKQVFVSHYANGDHDWKSAEFMHTGTGYTRISSWHHHRTDCH
jgi:hypothetical protein